MRWGWISAEGRVLEDRKGSGSWACAGWCEGTPSHTWGGMVPGTVWNQGTGKHRGTFGVCCQCQGRPARVLKEALCGGPIGSQGEGNKEGPVLCYKPQSIIWNFKLLNYFFPDGISTGCDSICLPSLTRRSWGQKGQGYIGHHLNPYTSGNQRILGLTLRALTYWHVWGSGFHGIIAILMTASTN